MFKYYGNRELLNHVKVGICGSLYPSDYANKVTIEFVKKQKKVLLFHDEIGIAKIGIDTAIINQQELIVITKKKRIIPEMMKDKMLIIEVDNAENILYIQLFETLVDKLTVIELARSSRLLMMIDNLLGRNIEIYVVPGQIDSEKSSGSNLLIAEGANMLYDELEI